MTAATRRAARACAVAVLSVPLLLPALPAQGETMAQVRAREEAARHALEDSTAEVQRAGAALARVEAELPAAQQAASEAKGELAGARAKASAARAEADRAEAKRVAAEAQVAEATALVEKSRDDVDQLARRAYQRGRLGDLREVMEATDPQDALERSEMLQSVFRFGTASLDRVTSARLVLASKTAALAKQEKLAKEARERADAEEARATQAAAAADAAVARVESLIAQRASALAEAQRLREADRRAYAQAQADSRALAEKIRRLEAERRAREAAEAARRAAQARNNGPRVSDPAPSSSGWLWPGRGRLTSRYGWRTHPIYGDRRFHAGIDLGGGYGAPVLATKDGVVIYAGYASGYGTLIVVSHGGGISSSYAHMSSLAVRDGQAVRRGQTIGRIGNAGNSTGPHLHFEIRINGDPVDPLRYVSPP